MKKRSRVDFSKHELEIIQDTHSTIYKFKKPGTIVNSLIFINSCGVLTVTGDFGNLVFCREFHPSADEKVSDGYWDEKLEIHSKQLSCRYDSEETEKALIKWIREEKYESWLQEALEEDERPSDEELDSIEHPDDDWFNNLLYNVYDEFSYTYVAYRETPSECDFEDIPFVKTRHYLLDIVYDGFDEICDRITQINLEK